MILAHQVMRQAERSCKKHPEWRLGQSLFNTLYELRPELANEIRGDHKALDPFYLDRNIPAFLEWLKDKE